MTEYRASTEWNHYDYCNAYFHLLDTIGLDQVIAYRECVIHPRSAFDRFLNERGYIGMDYLGDIIGTQCLREMRYEEAVKYFELVSSSYQYTLNTYKDKCMWRDPGSTLRRRFTIIPIINIISHGKCFLKNRPCVEHPILTARHK